MHIRLSQARLSSTVLPLFEKFIIRRAIDAVTTAAIVDMRRIWLYTSCNISVALVHIVAVPDDVAKAGCCKVTPTTVLIKSIYSLLGHGLGGLCST